MEDTCQSQGELLGIEETLLNLLVYINFIFFSFFIYLFLFIYFFFFWARKTFNNILIRLESGTQSQVLTLESDKKLKFESGDVMQWCYKKWKLLLCNCSSIAEFSSLGLWPHDCWMAATVPDIMSSYSFDKGRRGSCLPQSLFVSFRCLFP